MLEAKRLTKYYGCLRCVSDVSFHAKRGEILGCLGPNGSGKSTTMRMVAGLLEPTRGEILLDGQRTSKDLVGYKSRLGYVPEEPNLYPYLSGIEYLQLVGSLRQLPEPALGKKIAQMLDAFGLHGQRHSALGTYSKGMRQKILVIAALLHNPDVLIFDEPLSGLDPNSALVFRDLMQALARAGKVVLYSSHVLEVVEKVCSRVMILQGGRVVAYDSVQHLRQLMAAPSLERLFVELTKQPDSEQTAKGIVELAKA